VPNFANEAMELARKKITSADGAADLPALYVNDCAG
jgi:hypothetical protein